MLAPKIRLFAVFRRTFYPFTVSRGTNLLPHAPRAESIRTSVLDYSTARDMLSENRRFLLPFLESHQDRLSRKSLLFFFSSCLAPFSLTPRVPFPPPAYRAVVDVETPLCCTYMKLYAVAAVVEERSLPQQTALAICETVLEATTDVAPEQEKCLREVVQILSSAVEQVQSCSNGT